MRYQESLGKPVALRDFLVPLAFAGMVYSSPTVAAKSNTNAKRKRGKPAKPAREGAEGLANASGWWGMRDGPRILNFLFFTKLQA